MQMVAAVAVRAAQIGIGCLTRDRVEIHHAVGLRLGANPGVHRMADFLTLGVVGMPALDAQDGSQVDLQAKRMAALHIIAQAVDQFLCRG